MNQSPNTKLGDQIRMMNSDISKINIIEGENGKHYISKFNIESFMNDSHVDDLDTVISGINEAYNIDNLEIVSEASTDPEAAFVYNVMSLIESINAKEIIETSHGRNILKKFIDQAAAFILNRKYDEVSELKRCIKKCDDALKDIAEEKKVAKDKSENESYKFTLTFIADLAKTILIFFVGPYILSKKIKWPAFVTDVFKVKQIPAVSISTPKFVGKVNNISNVIPKGVKKAGSAALTIGNLLDAGIPEDLKGIYLSIKDYEQLLNHYEDKIKRVKNGLESQLKSLEGNKGQEDKVMFKLEEDVMPENDENVTVHYMVPSETDNREVLHDEKDAIEKNPVEDIKKANDSEMEAPSSGAVTIEPPKMEGEPELPEVKEKSIEDAPKYNPMEAIEKARCNPINVLVTRFNDKYYIALDDLKRYMNACKVDDYDKAADDVISANNDPEFNHDNLKIILGSSELENCSTKDKEKLEAASLEFEIYPDK